MRIDGSKIVVHFGRWDARFVAATTQYVAED